MMTFIKTRLFRTPYVEKQTHRVVGQVAVFSPYVKISWTEGQVVERTRLYLGEDGLLAS